jgi:UDP-arabinose 4-epimerase
VKILVTGGAGYVGSHACKALAAAGHEPVVYDNLSTGHRWAVRWGPLVEGDLRDRERLAWAFAEYRPDMVMHFAARAYVGESVADPQLYYDNNVGGTLALLSEMRRHDVRRIVFSSTCATYGIPQVVPIGVDTPQQPVNPYGHSKLHCERMLRDFCTAYGFAAVALRYFNAAGADPEGEIGEAHDPETHLIPLALAAAAGDIEVLEVYGDDWPTPDGTCVRDYVHVEDLAQAHVLAIARTEIAGFQACNLGVGRGFSIRVVLDTVARVTGRTVPIRMAARRAGDPPTLVAAPGAATEWLGWQPRHITLDSIIDTAWRWYRQMPR